MSYLPSKAERKPTGQIWFWTFLLAGTGVLFYALLSATVFAPAAELKSQIDFRILKPLEYQFWWLVSPSFLIVLAVTLGLQRLIPADPGQRNYGAGFVNDAIWFLYTAIGLAFINTLIVTAFAEFYQSHLSFMTITAVADWPAWARFILAVLLFDFMIWLVHVAEHKISWLWPFHAVHHEQRELNFFSDFRVHPVSFLWMQSVTALVFFIFAMEVPEVVAFSIFRALYSKFYHGNIKTDLGPLRYILVTPQSHRVHHSLAPEHRDKNFGSMFSIWDFLFRTQVKDFDIYPVTGSDDPTFPHERLEISPTMLVTPLRQMLHPFFLLWRRLPSQLGRARFQGPS